MVLTMIGSPRGQRIGRACLGIYLLFLLYGSFFPFEFATDPAAIRGALRSAVVAPYDAVGHRRFSLPDVASNTLLGLPFGFLLVASNLVGSSAARRLLTAGCLSFVVAGAVEVGQVLTPDRTPSTIDVATQVIGSVTGALLAHMALGALRGAPTEPLAALLRRRPVLGPLALLMAILMADALYPYVPTLDISTVWSSLKHARSSPLLADGAWHAVLVERALPYGILGALAAAVLSPRSRAGTRALAWVACVAWAVGLEISKLFVESRSPEVDHVAAAAVGALAGVLVARDRSPAPRALVVGAACLMAYAELAPFDFTWASSGVAGIEWRPFGSYYHAEPTRALFDAGKKLLLGGLLGGSLRAAAVRAPVLWAAGLAVLLEALQLLEPSHHAASGDVLILTAGGACGAALLTRYRAMLDSA